MNFTEFAYSLGVKVEDPIADGNRHRVRCVDDRSGKRSGWYVFFGSRGIAGNWKHGGEAHYWHSGSTNGLPSDPIEAERERQMRALDQARKSADAIKQSKAMLGRAKESDGTHPYLQKKRVKPHGLSINGSVLLIPLYSSIGEIETLQTIASDGDKRFISGGKTGGCFHLIGDLEEKGRVLLAEGWATGATLHEATGYPVLCAMNCTNLARVAKKFHGKYELMVCADDDSSTEENSGKNPGIEKAMETARDFKLRMAIPPFKNRSLGTDFNDLKILEGSDIVRQQIETAWHSEHLFHRLDDIVKRIASESADQAAKDAGGWGEYFDITKRQFLDLVKKERPAHGAADDSDQKVKEPWPEPVDGAVLLDELVSVSNSFIHQPEHYHHVDALWTVLTYCPKEFVYSPILLMTSPEPECGKSLKLDVFQIHCNAPFRTGNATGPVIYRAIEKYEPTMLVDEFDSVTQEQRDAISNVLCGGFQKGGKAHRIETIGQKPEIVEFDCYCPKAVVAIKASTFKRTVVSRSICMRMHRKPTSIKVERFRKYDGTDITRKCLRWSEDNKDAMGGMTIEMPENLSDRQQDIWEPLFVIAHVAGGHWPQRVRDAAASLFGASDQDVELVGNQLLAHVRQYFEETDTDRVFSCDLCNWLNELEDGSYTNWSHGKGLNQKRLAKELRHYDISPDSVRGESGTKKGYLKDWFKDAFERYLDAEGEPAPCPNRNNGTIPENSGQNIENETGTTPLCSVTENDVSAPKNRGGSVVPQETALNDGEVDEWM